MAAIGNLRKRSGLIAGIVGVSLLAFVMTGLFESGFSIFGEDMSVGVIAGKKIKYEEYNMEFNLNADRQMRNSEASSMDDNMSDMVSNITWEFYIRQLVMEPEYRSLGLNVTDAELTDIFLGVPPDPMIVPAFTDQQSGQINQNFVDEKGQLSGQKIKQYVDELSKRAATDKQVEKLWEQWKDFEISVRDNKYQNKYFNLLKKGLQVTTSYAKQDYKMSQTSVRFRYVLKRYNAVADSTLTVTEEEMQKYYNENKARWKQELSAKVDYLVFDVLPSDQDKADAEKEINRVADEFAKTENDTQIIVRESENPNIDGSFLKLMQLPPSLSADSQLVKTGKGYVTKPYLEGTIWKVSKVMDVKSYPDSASVRHILFNYAGSPSAAASVTRTKEQSKALADSILNLLKKKKVQFPDMVQKYSADSGSFYDYPDKKDPSKKVKKKREDLGAYRWFKEGAMVPEFQTAAFEGKVGDLVVVETTYGFHLIEVLDKGKESARYRIGTIQKTVIPSAKTKNDIYNEALDFLTQYGDNAETFSKGIQEKGMNMRTAETVTTTARGIPGVDNARDLIRWVFTNPQGTVCKEPFTYDNKYVIPVVTELHPKGFATLEQKKVEVELGAKKEKKAKMFMEEFAKSGKSLSEIANKLQLTVDSVPGIRYNDFSVPGLGREMTLMGTVFALEPGKMSKPLMGEQGVYIVMVEKVTPAPESKDYTQQKINLKTNLQYRVDASVSNILRDKAGIQDTRYKFY
ncbi:MAG: SurA N-terminal domain-containing protein [Bacteroidia bacterium]|nr:SurA N-terminal domain-containing protein [Bacteroidia bacterium]